MMAARSGDPGKRRKPARKRTRATVSIVHITEPNTTLPDHLKGYKPFIGVPKKPEPPADAPPAGDAPAA
jgi:hypothetical protein